MRRLCDGRGRFTDALTGNVNSLGVSSARSCADEIQITPEKPPEISEALLRTPQIISLLAPSIYFTVYSMQKCHK